MDVNIKNAEADFKKQLKDLSKNELVRQACNFYQRLVLANFKNQILEEQISKLTAPAAQESENK
jgi:hypothetical protein